LHDSTKSDHIEHPDLQAATEGEFAGWRNWTRDNYENHTGPFWHRTEADGRISCAFRVQRKHLNGAGNVHGGCFMSFADYCLFALASPVLQGSGVTVSFACEFLDAAGEGELIECFGKVTRAGGSLIFVRGELKSAERLLFTFSGTIKRVKPKAAAKP
jgi:acyl-coenzyme A thioesterase PaaI-like protein